MKTLIITTAALLMTFSTADVASAGSGFSFHKNGLTVSIGSRRHISPRLHTRVQTRVHHRIPSYKIVTPPTRRCHTPVPAPVVHGVWCSKLGAMIAIERVYLPRFGHFTAARILSEPVWGSPLRQIGLRTGDVITRIDNHRVTDLRDLESHHGHTHLRFFKANSDIILEDHVDICHKTVFHQNVNHGLRP